MMQRDASTGRRPAQPRGLRALPLAGLMGLLLTGTALAQGISGPAEIPSNGFTGRQYVDSKGCVFLRAGMDGRTIWVPRINRDRSQMCGRTPSGTEGSTPAPVASAAPAPVASAAPAAAPKVASNSTATIVDAPIIAHGGIGTDLSPANLPDGVTRSAPRPSEPAMTSNAQLVQPSRAGNDQGFGASVPDNGLGSGRSLPAAPAGPAVQAGAGSKPNPLIDDLSGQTMRTLAETAPAAAPAVSPGSPPPAMSTGAVAGRYVQVGTFAEPGNARRLQTRLSEKGIPSVQQSWRRNGRLYHVVLAGPYQGGQDLDLGLQAVKAQGFRDAFIRR